MVKSLNQSLRRHIRIHATPFVLPSCEAFFLFLLTTQMHFAITVEPRFNEVAGDQPNLFVKSRVRYIENLDITNLRGNDQNVRYIEVIVNDWKVLMRSGRVWLCSRKR